MDSTVRSATSGEVPQLPSHSIQSTLLSRITKLKFLKVQSQHNSRLLLLGRSVYLVQSCRVWRYIFNSSAETSLDLPPRVSSLHCAIPMLLHGSGCSPDDKMVHYDEFRRAFRYVHLLRLLKPGALPKAVSITVTTLQVIWTSVEQKLCRMSVIICMPICRSHKW